MPFGLPLPAHLSFEREVDIDVYANKNFSPLDLKRMKRDLTIRSLTNGGMRRTHTVDNLVAEMAEMGVVRSVLLPIDFPALSRNADTYLDVAAREPRLLSYGSVHPYARDVAGKLQSQKERGRSASSDAARAFSLTALKLRPGGSIRPFCEPATVTSTRHSSWR